MNKLNEILKSALNKVKPSEEEMNEINGKSEELIKIIKEELKKIDIKTEVFVGGSFAKGTLIKKKNYDIDIFARFSGEVNSNFLEEALRKISNNIEKIHGSRDYFIIKDKNRVYEIVPVKMIKTPREAENSADLSYFHVNYVKGRIAKNKKLANDILLAKAFCYASGCYGAESYVMGFSGYAIELLVLHYKGFLQFIKAMAKAKSKIILDDAKHYKGKEELLAFVNEAKLQSPIIVIDPTFKERNATAALSNNTFKKFQDNCRKFLNKPSLTFFEEKEFDIGAIKKEAKKKKAELISLALTTDRQAGDIAGTKLRKVSEFILREIEKYAVVIRKEFDYDGKKTARAYFAVKKEKKLLLKGPPIKMTEHAERFRQAHKKTIVKKGVLYAVENIGKIADILNKAIKDKREALREMGVTGVKVLP